MHRMVNVVQPYAWGSREALAALRGEPPTPGPEAELWMGAHPLAPSRLEVDGALCPLDELIARAPGLWLGADLAARFGGRLPFLLKVLAAAEPLSLQAHPSRERAAARFAAEERAGVPLGAPHRGYKDPNHKPEILCALTRFEALYGFRDVAGTVSLLRALETPALGGLLQRLTEPVPLRATVAHLFGLAEPERTALVAAVVEACARAPAGWEAETRWALRMAAAYPGDVGVVVALLMNLVRLEPGEALYLPAGNLHAYLEGTGVELMANSDNVLRGGLTRKHVDVPELMEVLDFSPVPPHPLRAERAGPEWVYRTTAEDFRLSRLEEGPTAALPGEGAQILLCTRGRAELRRGEVTLVLRQGESAFVPAGWAPVQVRNEGQLFRATSG